LILQAAMAPKYKWLVDDAVNYAKKTKGDEKKKLREGLKKTFVNFGSGILT